MCKRAESVYSQRTRQSYGLFMTRRVPKWNCLNGIPDSYPTQSLHMSQKGRRIRRHPGLVAAFIDIHLHGRRTCKRKERSPKGAR